jgi:IclR family transcriptional regulator, acetate operon repressor
MNNPAARQSRTAQPRDTTVQSVDRAVTILEILARQGEVGVTEIAAQLGVHKSTASRLLSVLERRGLTMQMSGRGRYRLGFRLLLLANATVGHLDITQLSRPVCERLAGTVGETVNVAVLEDEAVINVAQVRGTAAVSSHNWIGQRTPLHATSSGKVLLAHLAHSRRARYLSQTLDRFTPATVVDAGVLERQLAEVAERGWAFTVEELEVGLNAVAAPIRSYEGHVIAAVSVSGPSYRLPAEAVAGIAVAVVRAADEISEQLGFRLSAPP